LEHQGVNGFSSLPRDKQSYLRLAGQLGAESPPVTVPAGLSRRAVDDVIYSISTMAMAWRYPRFERHWPYGQLEEYWYGGRRLISRSMTARRRKRQIEEIINNSPIYYVFPLQVDVDSQIIFHSHFAGQGEVIESVVASFARHAPSDAVLVFTEHPLETSPTNWEDVVTMQAAASGISARVRFLPGGSPQNLLSASSGIVVVNSTTGFLGLELGIPVVALSPAVFNVVGMTFQDGLDRFWTEGRPADPDLVEAFRRVVIDRTQINGDFFSERGIGLAVASALPRLGAVKDRLPGPVNRNTSMSVCPFMVPLDIGV
jgi:capsular polysaccharide export protein